MRVLILITHRPSTTALRAFEAAARHLNFTSAGRELNVTAGAIRNRVRALEEDLGFKLFRRVGNKFELSDAGRTMLPDLKVAFKRIDRAVQRLGELEEQPQVLTIRTLPTFASNWLVSRLHRFNAVNARVDVRIDGSFDVADFARDQVDILLHYDNWDHTGLHVEPLFEEEIFPVCSPGLIDGDPPLKSFADLGQHTLLDAYYPEERRDWSSWDRWLQAAGVEHPRANQGPRFSHRSQVFQMAEQGYGVAIGDPTASDALAAGRLVKPFDLSVKVGVSFCLICPVEALKTHKVAVFRDWIVAEKPPQ